MDNRADVREFLVSRRAKLTPTQVGLPGGSNRRVPGLRRAEVAMLAYVSIEYYSRVERGALAGVSDSVLEAIARALQLDEAERGHLLDLARAANNTFAARRRTRPSRTGTVRPGLQAALDAITTCPALIRNGRMDLLATNLLGRAFYTDLYAMGDRVPNIARYTFLEAGRDPHDKELHDLIGELSTRRDEFRTRWGAHNVRRHGSGIKHFHHPIVGDLTFTYEGLEVTEDPGLQFLIYTTQPGSASEERIRLLGSWAVDQPWAERYVTTPSPSRH